MPSPSKTGSVEIYPFTIHDPSEDIHITVYNGKDQVVYQGYGDKSLNLRRGIYVVRSKLADEMYEEVVRHSGPRSEFHVHPPLRYSSTTLFQTATTHEYYSYPSQQISKLDTAPHIGTPGTPQARFFLFMRANNRQSYKGEDFSQGLSLLDRYGVMVSAFEPTVTQRDTVNGSLAFSAPAAPGPFFLRFDGEPSRELPITLYDQWETQVFITYHQRPLLEGLTVLMAHLGAGFEPDNNFPAHAVDMALTGLQNNQDFMPREVMNALLYGKFDNPMLGLLGAHLLMRKEEVSESQVNIVLGNLNHLMPDSPDVKALRLIQAMRFGKNIPQMTIQRPPMLRAGLEAVIAASIEQPDLLPENGLIERIAPRLYADSPWSSWRALPQTTSAAIEGKAWQSLSAQQGEEDWLEASLKEAIAWSVRTNRPLDLKDLARQFSVPVRTLERIYGDLMEV